MPNSYLSRKLNFVNRSIGLKVIHFAADVGAKALSNIWANGVLLIDVVCFKTLLLKHLEKTL